MGVCIELGTEVFCLLLLWFVFFNLTFINISAPTFWWTSNWNIKIRAEVNNKPRRRSCLFTFTLICIFFNLTFIKISAPTLLFCQNVRSSARHIVTHSISVMSWHCQLICGGVWQRCMCHMTTACAQSKVGSKLFQVAILTTINSYSLLVVT